MCGIIGYCGEEKALPVLLDGLSTLEYRGYDSAGVALQGPKELKIVKTQGRLSALKELLRPETVPKDAHCGIGHTRWATHGAPCLRNAHPHATPRLALVHNGIIENYADIEACLHKKGCEFVSETDTEAAAWLIDDYYRACGDPVTALFRAADDLRGSFAFAVLFRDFPDTVYAMRRDSPLIVARDARGTYLASDVPAILPYTHTYFRPEENVVCVLTPNAVRFFTSPGKEVTQPTEQVDWDVTRAQKGGYSHFMHKEIHEQPEALEKTIRPRLRDGLPFFELPLLDGDELGRFRRLIIVACGTAMHAGLIGKTLTEKLARLPVQVEIASEFRYRDPILRPAEDLVILLSQSGETADTLAALRHAKAQGVRTLAIVNVVGSSVAREADAVLYTLAGPEIAVASTKAYSVQCALLWLISLRLALVHGQITEEKAKEKCEHLLRDVPAAVGGVLAREREIAAFAPVYGDAEHLFFIGRGIDADLCTEASLKLKEISYVHSEAYAAGELKHGTISLIVGGVPVIALLTDPGLAEKTISGIREVLSRGARVLVFATEEIAGRFSLPGDRLFVLPPVPADMALFPAVCAMQLFAYFTAVARGCDVDKPRNLAKSVTVE